MDAQTAMIALQLLNRIQISGAEVDAFIQVRQALQAEGRPAPDPVAMEARAKATADLEALRLAAKAQSAA